MNSQDGRRDGGEIMGAGREKERERERERETLQTVLPYTISEREI